MNDLADTIAGFEMPFGLLSMTMVLEFN